MTNAVKRQQTILRFLPVSKYLAFVEGTDHVICWGHGNKAPSETFLHTVQWAGALEPDGLGANPDSTIESLLNFPGRGFLICNMGTMVLGP